MKLSWNVIRSGIAVTASMAMLSACQGGFKSRVFSDQEVAAYKKALAAEEAKKHPTSDKAPDTNPDERDLTCTNAPIDKDKQDSQQKPPPGGGATPPVDPTHVNPPELAGAGAGSGAGASLKLIIEASERAKFIKDNNNRLAMPKDPEVSKLIPVVTLTIKGDEKSATFGIKAVVVINGENRILGSADTNMTAEKDTNITPITTVLSVKDGPEITNQTDVVVYSICLDTCAQVQTVIKFTQPKGDLYAVFLSQPDKETYIISATNLLDGYQTFEKFIGPQDQGPDAAGDAQNQKMDVDKIGGKNDPEGKNRDKPAGIRSERSADAAQDNAKGGKQDQAAPAPAAAINAGGQTTVTQTSPQGARSEAAVDAKAARAVAPIANGVAAGAPSGAPAPAAAAPAGQQPAAAAQPAQPQSLNSAPHQTSNGFRSEAAANAAAAKAAAEEAAKAKADADAEVKAKKKAAAEGRYNI